MRIMLVMLVGLLLAAAGQDKTPQPTTLAVGSATLDEIKGEVTVQPPQGTPGKAQRGQTLAPETVIETHNGSALLHLDDGSQVLIKKNSRVVLKVPNQGSGSFFELLLGKIIAKVQKRIGNAPSFRMGTPTAVVTVRGTQFEVDVDKKGKTYVLVFEGLVEVASVNAPQSPVLVRPGYRTTVSPAGMPEPPESLLNNPLYQRPGENEREWGPGNQPGENDRNTETQQNSEKPD
jgi:FecR-like protein